MICVRFSHPGFSLVLVFIHLFFFFSNLFIETFPCPAGLLDTIKVCYLLEKCPYLVLAVDVSVLQVLLEGCINVKGDPFHNHVACFPLQ